MLMYYSLRSFLLITVAGIILCGCAGNSSQPVFPDNPDSSSETTVREELDANSADPGHYLMHFGYIFIDPDHPDGPLFEVIPVREVETHLNVLKFLEVSLCTDCFKIVGFNFPEPDKLDIDILIEHPFDYLDLSVFDVRAIIMFNGSHEYPECGKTISDPALGDGAVLNPDGYTALYNGSTLMAPAGEFKKYFPGKLATWLVPDSDINGYKYFITDDPSNNRNAFYAGSSDVQTFSLQLPTTGSFVVGYAVDANWWPPISMPVDDPLVDFDINANCTEPWKVIVTEDPVGIGLTDLGGQTKLLIDVYDWQGKSTYYEPVIECAEIFDGILTSTWVSDEPDFTRYEVSVSNEIPAPVGDYKCLVAVEAIENNPIDTPWLDLTAYQVISLEVTEGPTVGNLIWARQAGGVNNDRGSCITTLSDDSLVMAGDFGINATFGQGDANETFLTSSSGHSIFIARYNPDGSLVWVTQTFGPDWNYSEGITTLSDDSIVLIGEFRGTVIFGQDEPNETVLFTEDIFEYEIFIARYNPDGTLAWVSQTHSDGYDYSNDVTTLSDDSIVVTGEFGYPDGTSVTFGQGEQNETVLYSAGIQDIFIARYNPDGSLEWAKKAGGDSSDMGNGITSLSDNSTVVTGSFASFIGGDAATFGQGEPNETVLHSEWGTMFIARYNPDGTLAWVKQAGGGSRAITVLSDDSSVVTGVFSGTATFGRNEPNETNLDSTGVDLFVARYNPDGSLLWAKQAFGNAYDPGYSITALSDDSTVVTGIFSGSTIFGRDEPNEIVLTSAGDHDIYVARYMQDGSLAWAKRAGGANDDEGADITTLSDNSTVVTGTFASGWHQPHIAIFGLHEPFETVLESAGVRDIFIARYAP